MRANTIWGLIQYGGGANTIWGLIHYGGPIQHREGAYLGTA